MDETPTQIVIIDPQRLFVEALAAQINRQTTMQVCAIAFDGATGFQQILDTAPDLVVMDVDLPHRGAFEIANRLHGHQSPPKVVFLSHQVSDVMISRAREVHAAGFLLKTEAFEMVVEDLQQIADGEDRYSPAIADRLLRIDSGCSEPDFRPKTRLESLTERQLEVLCLLASGHSVKEVAKILHVSEKSADSHKYRIMKMLNIHDRVKLARYAIREGLSRL